MLNMTSNHIQIIVFYYFWELRADFGCKQKKENIERNIPIFGSKHIWRIVLYGFVIECFPSFSSTVDTCYPLCATVVSRTGQTAVLNQGRIKFFMG